MTKEKDPISTVRTKCPLCVNLERLKVYLLAPDEAVLFDWFVIKQSIFYNYKPFPYKRDDIIAETNIKRDRLSVIIKRFEAMGIVKIEKNYKTITGGKSMLYKVDWMGIWKKLPELFDTTKKQFKDFESYFKAHIKLERLKDKKPISFVTEMDEGQVMDLYEWLCSGWKARLTLYDEKQNESNDHIEIKHKAIQLPINKTIKLGLWRLLERYDKTTIYWVFVAFADYCLKHDKKENLMSRFVAYDEINDTFPHFDASMNNYTANYCMTSEK